MTALTFALASLSTGDGLGYAMICLEARYASVGWFREAGLDRKFVAPADWRMFNLALSVGIPDAPLESTHIVQRMLVPADWQLSVLVQRVAELRLDVPPARVAERLDAWLLDLAARYDGQPRLARPFSP